jgi:pimeloyl-ACP methyl ester carboxylesterase
MHELEIGEAHVLGRRIHELRGGTGSPLLYLHSALGEALPLPYLVELAHRYELHVPAHPGFLTSQGIDQIRDIEDLVYHYLAYMDAKGWKSVNVLGLSLGGWIGAEIAARYPDRVANLALVSSVGIWIREQPITDIFTLDSRYPDRLQKLLFYDTQCEGAQMIGTPDFENTPDELLVNVLNALAATAKVGWNPLLHDPRLEALLPRVTARTLCLWGSDDRDVGRAYGEKFTRLIPNAELHIIEQCGHLPPLEKPAEFLAEITKFFG